MICIISCTNRPNSNSIKVAQYYKELLSTKGVEAQVLDLTLLPEDFIFSALYDNMGKNPAFNKLAEIIGSSDKFIFVVPEYNGSYPGILKSFIDGLKYPNTFKEKKCAMVGIGTGVMGGALALSHLTDVVNYLGMHVYAVKARLPRVNLIFQEGKITDELLEKLIDSQAEGFIKF